MEHEKIEMAIDKDKTYARVKITSPYYTAQFSINLSNIIITELDGSGSIGRSLRTILKQKGD